MKSIFNTQAIEPRPFAIDEDVLITSIDEDIVIKPAKTDPVKPPIVF